MSFVTQLAVVVVGGILLLAISSVINTGRFPLGIRAVPRWGWLVALGVAVTVGVALAVRRRRMRTIRVFYHNLFTRRHGEPVRIWLPEDRKKPALTRARAWLKSLLSRLFKSRNRRTRPPAI